MNKIVKEHYPADKLPRDLRGNLAKGAHVKVEVTEEAERKPAQTRDALIAELRRHQEANRGKGISTEEAVRRIRELRDEWDD